MAQQQRPPPRPTALPPLSPQHRNLSLNNLARTARTAAAGHGQGQAAAAAGPTAAQPIPRNWSLDDLAEAAAKAGVPMDEARTLPQNNNGGGGGHPAGSRGVREVEGWNTFVRAAQTSAGARGGHAGRMASTRTLGAIAGAASWARCWQRVGGTMPEAAVWVAKRGGGTVQFADAVLRGTSQVFLINNPVSGGLMLLAMSIGSWWQAALGLLALATATLAAYLLGLPAESRRAGLFGYNGVLVGSALALFHFGGDGDPGAIMPQLLVVAAVCGAFSTVATAAVGRVTVALLGLAPFTFPFQARAARRRPLAADGQCCLALLLTRELRTSRLAPRRRFSSSRSSSPPGCGCSPPSPPSPPCRCRGPRPACAASPPRAATYRAKAWRSSTTPPSSWRARSAVWARCVAK
jgi:hypothetical protein